MRHLPELIETDRLRLTRLKYEDAEEIFYAYASKLEATRFVSWATHQSIADTNNYLMYAVAAWHADLEYNYSIRLKSNNRLIGSIGVVNDCGKYQFGYIISPLNWNQGYATEACKVMIERLQKVEDVFKIWTFVDVDNVASSNVLLKSGMIEETRLTQWYRFVNQGDQPKDCILYYFPLIQ